LGGGGGRAFLRKNFYGLGVSTKKDVGGRGGRVLVVCVFLWGGGGGGQDSLSIRFSELAVTTQKAMCWPEGEVLVLFVYVLFMRTCKSRVHV